VFAAQRASDNAVTVMVISKYLSGTTPVTVALNNFSSGPTAQVYQLTSGNAISRLADLSVAGSAVSFTAPAQSITLLVLPKSGVANQPPTAVASATPTSGIGPLAVSFSGANSSDSDGTIPSYSWAFGDGGTGSGVAPAHAYQNAGNYTAVLTVTDNQGATATASVGISVTTNPNVINAPSNLTGKGAKSSATLSWRDNSNNETGFTIERAASGSSTFTQVGSVAANAIGFKDTVSKGAYIYRVRAFNGSATSAYSNLVTVSVR
jgi:PKD repeat protein